MGVEILNLKFIGLYFVMFFFSLAEAGSKVPILEVVSIYNDNFTTPVSRDPYFIEVHRCVGGVYSGNGLVCESGEKAVQENYTLIEIVVPDSDNRSTFYKYVVYNHTSCKCASLYTERKLYGKEEKVSETYFRSQFRHNPINLRKKCGFCDTAHPRYRQHDHFYMLTPNSRYYLQHQCLPGCWNKSSVAVNLTKNWLNGGEKQFVFTNDTKCEAYDQPSSQSNRGNAQQSTGAPQPLLGNSGSFNESNDKLIISIGSARMFLVALVLSFVLFIVLILDFGLWRGKKGFFYALCSCTGRSNAEDSSRSYYDRRINEATV